MRWTHSPSLGSLHPSGKAHEGPRREPKAHQKLVLFQEWVSSCLGTPKPGRPPPFQSLCIYIYTIIYWYWCILWIVAAWLFNVILLKRYTTGWCFQESWFESWNTRPYFTIFYDVCVFFAICQRSKLTQDIWTVLFCQFHGCKAVPLAHRKQRQAFSGNVVSKRFHALDPAASNRNAIWSRSLGVGDSLANVSRRPKGWWLLGFNWLFAALENHACPECSECCFRDLGSKLWNALYVRIVKGQNMVKYIWELFVYCLWSLHFRLYGAVRDCTCTCSSFGRAYP